MNKVVILLGPTGVGKTGVSLLLAKILHTEIINADSMQIYRHMDIGTAKPSPGERKDVKHHMINIADPWETYSTGKYIAAVSPIFENLHRQGEIPVVVGGTGLYIKAMTRGIFSGPSADWRLREELLAMEQEEKGTLYDYLKALDPVAIEKITPNDTRRIIRALEVCLKGSAKMSEMQQTLTQPLPYEFIKIGITRVRKELYRMIEERVDGMVKAGLIEEVRKVIKMTEDAVAPSPHLAVSSFTSMQAIGYKEIALHLRGEMPLAESVICIKKASRRYAKRQFTWFRKEENIHWFDITGITDHHEVLNTIYPVLSRMLRMEQIHQTLQY
ncbi:MAG TPA: tRNA (adenosine(37)-N6)-dimethylallyltransferase MiaA [Thermodesulfovibrionales bacterium]|jgi:tRNA dimethylallyltransferase|nr:tRNA (adenosine(37)-N6)-dimethylallyltransferase MiaA [Thermodesulfovibrionales bacterium]